VGDEGSADPNQTATKPGSNTSDEGSSDGSEASANRTGSEESSNANKTSSSDGADGDDEPRRAYPPWPKPSNAAIRPGVQVTGEGQCTSNFLFRTPDNATLMLGVAAHCVSEGDATQTNGCTEDVEPLAPGAQVEIENATKPGTLVYNSWDTMRTVNETTAEACRSNDFALVAIHADDRPGVSPAVKAFGGPTDLANVDGGERVEWYGNTGATPDASATREHEGVITSTSQWRATMYSATPGVPGDSGSGVMLEDGPAIGVLSTVSATGSNGVTLLEPALAFANEYAGAYELVTWGSLDGDSVG